MSQSDLVRRTAAKRSNERVKLAANFTSALGLGVIGASFIVPGVVDLSAVRWTWIPLGIGLHLVAQLPLQMLKSED